MVWIIINKGFRELYRLCHPAIWGKKVQINGIPRIYDIRKLDLGKNVSLNSGCVLQCYGGLTIGNNVTVSDGAKILTRSLDIDNYLINSEKIARDHTDKSVRIDEGVWIATNAVVLPGVHITRKCIVAAGAVVSKSLLEEGCIYGGVPAKKIRKIEK